MEYWSWVLTGVGIVGLYAAGSKRKVGWLIGIFAQALWLFYGYTTEQYGFIVSAFLYGFVYLRNYVRWRNENRDSEDIDDE